MAFELPALPYAPTALEPYIDATTMGIHHGKHHQAYITNANAALEGTAFANESAESILTKLDQLPENIRTAVRNNAGGHANHSLFWTILAPPTGQDAPVGKLNEAITQAFGTFEAFKTAFETAAKTRFGSGWAWLVVNANGQLEVTSTPNQDSPLMNGQTPILGLDVWEHAYYLHYQNRRPDYVTAFWHVVNWAEVNRRYLEAVA